jgi:hypothetical protein
MSNVDLNRREYLKITAGSRLGLWRIAVPRPGRRVPAPLHHLCHSSWVAIQSNHEPLVKSRDGSAADSARIGCLTRVPRRLARSRGQIEGGVYQANVRKRLREIA